MTASTKPKTPSMTMKVHAGVAAASIDRFCKKASRLALSHIVDKITVKEQLVLKGESRSKEFTIDLAFYPRAEYEQEYDVGPLEILMSFATKFPLLFKKELQVELKKLDADLKSQKAELGKGKTVREHQGAAGDAEEDGDDPRGRKQDDDDDASEVGDGDATTSKHKRQRKEQATYEDEDEEDEDADEGGEMGDLDIEAAYASSSDDEGSDEDMDQGADSLAEEHDRVESLFMDNLPSATSFSFRDSGCTIGLQASLLPASHVNAVLMLPCSSGPPCPSYYLLG